jgi:hypothetical protein
MTPERRKEIEKLAEFYEAGNMQEGAKALRELLAEIPQAVSEPLKADSKPCRESKISALAHPVSHLTADIFWTEWTNSQYFTIPVVYCHISEIARSFATAYHKAASDARPSCHVCGSQMIKCHGCTSCGEHTLATVQAQPWIPVIERLPDIGKWVHLVIEGVVQVMPARLILAVFEDGKKYWEWADDTAFASPLEAASLWQYIPHYSPGVKTEYQSREVLPQKPGQQCGLCGECESLRQQRDAARKVIKVMMGRQSNRPWSEYTDSEVDSWIEETKGLVSMQPRMFTAWCSRPDCRKAYTADTAEHAAVNAQQCNHI